MPDTVASLREERPYHTVRKMRRSARTRPRIRRAYRTKRRPMEASFTALSRALRRSPVKTRRLLEASLSAGLWECSRARRGTSMSELIEVVHHPGRALTLVCNQITPKSRFTLPSLDASKE
jgi:hypothetical protein